MPKDRSYDHSPHALAGAIGAHIKWSRVTDRAAATEAARRAAAGRFDKQVPAEITDPVARAQAAEHLKKAHYLKMAAASARARRLKVRLAEVEAELASDEDVAE